MENTFPTDAVPTPGVLTCLVHGADAESHQMILSLERMRVIEDIDTLQPTATVQAGVTRQGLQEAVDRLGKAFPLNLGARGTATLDLANLLNPGKML